MKLNTKDIVYNAIIAALYIVLTLVSYPISFLDIQFRISEVLILLCFFNPSYILGLTLGCLICNIASPIFPFDMLIGTLSTLVSCLFIILSKHLLISLIFPILINSFAIGFELFQFKGIPFWPSVGFIAIGETSVLILGYVLILFLRKRKNFYRIIKANRNIDFKF